ncbi:MAG TPA: hypothetical protein PKC18_08165, partial [Lacipirellulaceae bacterium]|nr:hypothetical protein [Lacipirellulaceae bacterium]
MNLDWSIDQQDIPLFALALRNPRAYWDQKFVSADVIGNVDNNSRGLDFDDIAAFAAKLNMSQAQLLNAM